MRGRKTVQPPRILITETDPREVLSEPRLSSQRNVAEPSVTPQPSSQQRPVEEPLTAHRLQHVSEHLGVQSLESEDLVSEVWDQEGWVHSRQVQDVPVAEDAELLPAPMPVLGGLVCPLCQEILQDPVITVDGYSYCRRCITDWFRTHDKHNQHRVGGAQLNPLSPVTNAPLISRALIPNLALGKVLDSVRTQFRPAWVRAENARLALRRKLQRQSVELQDILAGSKHALLTAEMEAAHFSDELFKKDIELKRLSAELEQVQQQQMFDRVDAVGARAEATQYDTQVRKTNDELLRVQAEISKLREQERATAQSFSADTKALKDQLVDQRRLKEQMAQLRSELADAERHKEQHFTFELEDAKRSLKESEGNVRELQLTGTRLGSELVLVTQEADRLRADNVSKKQSAEETQHELQFFYNQAAVMQEQLEAIKRENALLLRDNEHQRKEKNQQISNTEVVANLAERLEQDFLQSKAEVKQKDDLLLGIPLLLSDFLQQTNKSINLFAKRSFAPEDVPSVVMQGLSEIHSIVAELENDLKLRNEQVADLANQVSGNQYAPQGGTGLAGAHAPINAFGPQGDTGILRTQPREAPQWRETPEKAQRRSTLRRSLSIAAGTKPPRTALMVNPNGSAIASSSNSPTTSRSGSSSSIGSEPSPPQALPSAPAERRRIKSTGRAQEQPKSSEPRRLSDAYSKVESRAEHHDEPTIDDLPTAVADGDIDLVHEIVAQSSPQQMQTKGSEALHIACTKGKVEIASLLIESNARVNARGGAGEITPLHAASFGGNVRMVQVLCKAKADVNAADAGGLSAMYVIAAYRGFMDVAKVLVAAKADVNCTEPKGKTAIVAADEAGFDKLSSYLTKVKHGLLV